MRVKLIFFGESVNIPMTSIGLGIGAISVWIDGRGYTSATNNLGALGYIFLETPEVEIGEPDPATLETFAHLHAQVVSFQIASNIFVSSGGVARIAMTRAVQQDGGLVDHKIEFEVTDCTGVSVTSNPVAFATEMFEMEHPVTAFGSVFAEEDLVAILDAAPAIEEGVA